MSFALTLPLVEATLFTAGCLVIHLLRRYADVMTAALACLLIAVVLMLGVAGAPEPFLRAQTASLDSGELMNLVN